jgi:hypothetical protein
VREKQLWADLVFQRLWSRIDNQQLGNRHEIDRTGIMVRMDLLLNPASPPPSLSPSDCAESPTEPQDSSFLGLALQVKLPPIVANKQSSLTSKAVLPTPTNQRLLDVSNTPHSPSNAPAVKRHKPELPALRLLLDGGSDNQRDDAPHEIFSGHAFWGKVPSLNPPAESPSDVSDIGTSSVLSKSSACKPISTLRGSSIVQDHGKALPLIAAVAAVVKTVPVNVTASPVEEEYSSLETETTMAASTTPSGKNGKKKKISICKEDGCSSQALSKNLCMKHGVSLLSSICDWGLRRRTYSRSLLLACYRVVHVARCRTATMAPS